VPVSATEAICIVDLYEKNLSLTYKSRNDQLRAFFSFSSCRIVIIDREACIKCILSCILAVNIVNQGCDSERNELSLYSTEQYGPQGAFERPAETAIGNQS
jgi:hypothetical protein